MEMLLDTLSSLGQNPFAWAVAAIAALKACFSLVIARSCPLATGKHEVTSAEAEAAAAARFNPSKSFLFIMLAGMALAIGGLYMMAEAALPALGLGAIVVGVFIFMTEPVRLQVDGARTAVYASGLSGAEASDLAREQLGRAYFQRFGYEALIATGVIAVLLLV